MHPPLNFDLKPGDVLIFHSDALHASELNRTDTTRFAVSFRVTFGKPHFPRGHYHSYDHAGMARGPWRSLAKIPANLQWSYFAYRLQWLKKKLSGGAPATKCARREQKRQQGGGGTGPIRRPARRTAPGTIRAVSSGVLVARLDDDRVVALSRRCPHKGADLVEGFVCGGEIVCPGTTSPLIRIRGPAPARPLFPCDGSSAKSKTVPCMFPKLLKRPKRWMPDTFWHSHRIHRHRESTQDACDRASPMIEGSERPIRRRCLASAGLVPTIGAAR